MISAGDTKVKALDTTGMVRVPDSTFMMGSDESGDEQPRHAVRVHEFWLDRHGVTNRNWSAYQAATQGIARRYEVVIKGCGADVDKVITRAEGPDAAQLAQSYRNRLDGQKTCSLTLNNLTPPSHQSPAGFDGPDQPVVNVSWDDAQNYCSWRGKRLPTEAEREKAAIGPTKGYDRSVQYATVSGAWNADEVVWNTNSTANVCSKGEKGYGFCDLSGNAWEWVSDWYNADYYKSSPLEDPQGPEKGETKVLRGGSWSYGYGAGGRNLRAAYRGYGHPGDRVGNIGFRCAASPEDSKKLR